MLRRPEREALDVVFIKFNRLSPETILAVRAIWDEVKGGKKQACLALEEHA